MEGYQRSAQAFSQEQVAQKARQAQQDHVERFQSPVGYQGNALGAERMPELSREAERVEILIERLGQICNELDGRLTPVLRCAPPSTGSNQCQRDMSSSPFGCRLAAIADRFDGQLEFLRDLLNRLEV